MGLPGEPGGTGLTLSLLESHKKTVVWRCALHLALGPSLGLLTTPFWGDVPTRKHPEHLNISLPQWDRVVSALALASGLDISELQAGGASQMP